jgi:hypothetical protein
MMDKTGHFWHEIAEQALDFIEFGLQISKEVSGNSLGKVTGGTSTSPQGCRKTTTSSKTPNSLRKLGV